MGIGGIAKQQQQQHKRVPHAHSLIYSTFFTSNKTPASHPQAQAQAPRHCAPAQIEAEQELKCSCQKKNIETRILMLNDSTNHWEIIGSQSLRSLSCPPLCLRRVWPLPNIEYRLTTTHTHTTQKTDVYKHTPAHNPSHRLNPAEGGCLCWRERSPTCRTAPTTG